MLIEYLVNIYVCITYIIFCVLIIMCVILYKLTSNTNQWAKITSVGRWEMHIGQTSN